MLYTFRFEGKKYAYDSVSGAVIQPGALVFKMLGAIRPPLTPVCPTSLRYELAKFDSQDVEEAYDEIWSLAKEGLLFAPEQGVIRVMTEGDHAFTGAGLLATALAEAFASASSPIVFEALGANQAMAKGTAQEVAARMGKVLA